MRRYSTVSAAVENGNTPGVASLTHDAVVVGGGPAGLSAATWLARHRRRVALVDGGERRNRWVEHTHGYLGLDPVEPAQLVATARHALLAYPTAEICEAAATSARRRPDGTFGVSTTGGDFVTRRLVLATGVEDSFPDVDGFFDHYGASVFHCPTCDGYEARDRRVVAFGWSEHVAAFALGLLDWAAEVTVVTDGSRFEGDAACRAALARNEVAVLEDDAVALLGRRGALEGVRLRGGATVPCELAFFSIAHRPRSELAVHLGCALTGEGCIVVDGDQETTVPGVYAAGDVAPGIQIVQVAAAQGAVAGVRCALSLRGHPAGPDAPE
ncbi:MAG TPA: NAD(P)/FAD-dependent oxidoreductase, partial [Acidimicrobiales bacterium]|nr:NAD(P)/FAD-dependent oxidoreductase [Acidimicrobiales bacterium]